MSVGGMAFIAVSRLLHLNPNRRSMALSVRRSHIAGRMRRYVNCGTTFSRALGCIKFRFVSSPQVEGMFIAIMFFPDSGSDQIPILFRLFHKVLRDGIADEDNVHGLPLGGGDAVLTLLQPAILSRNGIIGRNGGHGNPAAAEAAILNRPSLLGIRCSLASGEHSFDLLFSKKRSCRTELDSAEFDPSITQPFVLNPNGYRGECIGR